MGAARAAIVAQVTPVLEALDVRVEPYARNSTVDEPTVMVRLDRVVKARPWRTYEAALLVLVPQLVPGNADDELEALLEDVLHALDGGRVPWTAASRAVFEDLQVPGYEVALSVPLTITQE